MLYMRVTLHPASMVVRFVIARFCAARSTRELSVRRKLNAMPVVFEGKRVLLVDDSIVRGTTMSQIVDMVRRAGASKVCVRPPVQAHIVGLLSSLRLAQVSPDVCSRGACQHLLC